MRPKCDECGEPADYNFQDLWTTWVITDDPLDTVEYVYIKDNEENIGQNLHLCEKHAIEEGYI